MKDSRLNLWDMLLNRLKDAAIYIEKALSFIYVI